MAVNDDITISRVVITLKATITIKSNIEGEDEAGINQYIPVHWRRHQQRLVSNCRSCGGCEEYTRQRSDINSV